MNPFLAVFAYRGGLSTRRQLLHRDNGVTVRHDITRPSARGAAGPTPTRSGRRRAQSAMRSGTVAAASAATAQRGASGGAH
jgi:hypothetical protein